MSEYQNKIVQDLKNGAKLQCTEGSNYKTWLVYSNGNKRTIRRDSAEKICSEYENKLVFGELNGVRWKTPKNS